MFKPVKLLINLSYIPLLLLVRILVIAAHDNISKVDVVNELEIVWAPGIALFLLATIVDACYKQSETEKRQSLFIKQGLTFFIACVIIFLLLSAMFSLTKYDGVFTLIAIIAIGEIFRFLLKSLFLPKTERKSP